MLRRERVRIHAAAVAVVVTLMCSATIGACTDSTTVDPKPAKTTVHKASTKDLKTHAPKVRKTFP